MVTGMGLRGAATNVPAPWRTRSTPSRVSSSTALRTVRRLIPQLSCELRDAGQLVAWRQVTARDATEDREAGLTVQGSGAVPPDWLMSHV